MIKKNIMKKVIFTIFLTVLCLTIKAGTAQAASASISGDTKGQVNSSMTISVTGKAAQWNLKLIVDGKTIATSSELDSIKNKNISFSGKYKPTSAGKKTATIEGTITDADGTTTRSFKSKTLTISEKTTTTNNNSSSNNNSNNNNSNNNNATNNDSNASTDATLKNLGITPNDFSGFKKATTSYSVNVPKTTEKVSIYATPTNSKATVTGTGSKELKMGKNSFEVQVTAEDKKTTKTYTLNITRTEEEEVSKDATLKNLGIRPKEYDFTGFKMSKTNYDVTVPYNTEKITIYAYASNAKATVTGAGAQSVKVGKNTFAVKVTAEDKKTTKTYNLNVIRKEKDETDAEEPNEDDTNTKTTGLTNIIIKNYDLSPKFDKNVFEYTVDVEKDVEDLDVKVEAIKDVEAEVVGNEGLKEGKNIITILVRDTKTDATTTYQITANVGGAKGTALVTENTNSVSDTENDENTLVSTKPEVTSYRSNDKKKRYILTGAIVAIVLFTIIIIVKKHNSSDEYEDDEEYDEEDNISETRNFYNQMKDNDIYDEDEEPKALKEFRKNEKSGRYKGKRFK